MNKRSARHRASSAHDEWEGQWQRHWSKVGQPGYELPVGGPGADEREFLATARPPQQERARLKRITTEFERAFKTIADIGFGYMIDSPQEAVDLIVRSLPPAVRKQLRPAV